MPRALARRCRPPAHRAAGSPPAVNAACHCMPSTPRVRSMLHLRMYAMLDVTCMARAMLYIAWNASHAAARSDALSECSTQRPHVSARACALCRPLSRVKSVRCTLAPRICRRRRRRRRRRRLTAATFAPVSVGANSARHAATNVRKCLHRHAAQAALAQWPS